MIRVGEILRWRDFPFPRDPQGEIKARWFVCLGTTGLSSTPVFVYLCTTTTVARHYQPSGQRAGNAHFVIRRGEYGFAAECYLDVDANLFDDITEAAITKAGDAIEHVADPNPELLRRIWKQVLASRRIPKRVKNDIHASLNVAGITGLKRP